MVNAFAFLQLPVRPWLEESDVRNAFHRLATELHPDQKTGDSAQFAQLTTAFETLRHPLTRIRHLIELEALSADQGAAGVPPDLANLFPTVAQARQQLAAAIAKRQSAPNALARSLAAGELEKARRAAESVATLLESAYQSALDGLIRLDADWPSDAAKAALLPLHARLAFLTKWRDQLRESLLQLQLT